MDWPIQPLEIQRRFVPGFCPHRDCLRHRGSARAGFGFHRHGWYRRSDGRRVVRYRCGTCRRTFSKQTFALSYYLKRAELLLPVAAGLQAGSAHRQLARSLGCAPSTVTRLSARLGRHALLFHVWSLGQLFELEEALVADHFESFARCQDYPFGVATLVGSRSHFVYALDPAPHGRTGRRSVFQQARLRVRPRPDPRGGYAGSLARAVDSLTGLVAPRNVLHVCTDAHEDYPRALARVRARVRHEVYPNPPRGPRGAPRSPEAVRRDAAMFPNDLLHLLLRHSLAHHRRETIAVGRRLNALMERLYLAAVWRNFVKGVSERRGRAPTPAMRLGLARSPWSWARVLARRLFPGRLPVPRAWMEIYRREWITPGGPNAPHALRRAF